MLKKWIDQLIEEFGVELSPLASQPGGYRLTLQDGMELDALEGEGFSLLKAPIGSPPEQNLEAFFLRTMEANLFGMGTRGAAIGLDEEEKMLTLSLQVDYNSSYQDFREKVEDFISVLNFWRQELTNQAA